MPRGLILIILLLLVGAYFFLHGGSSSQAKLPGLAVGANVALSNKGYVVTLNGGITLPESEEYNIYDVQVEFYADDAKVQEKSLEGGVMKGPGEYPLSGSAVLPLSATSGKIKVNAKVLHGNRVEELVSEVPIVLPSTDMRIKAPQVFVGISSITPLDGNANVVLSVTFFNPNNASMSVSNAKIYVNGVERVLSINSVNAGSSSSTTASFVLPNKSKTVDVRVEGDYSVSGAKAHFSYTGTLSIPAIPFSRPYAHVSASSVTASNSGITFTLSGEIYNPNKAAVKVDRLYVKVYGHNNLIQEFNWLEGNTIAPEGNLALPSKTITVDEDMYKARVDVIMEYDGSAVVVASFPLLAVDVADMLEAPDVKATLSFDANTGRCTVTVSITNPNSKSIDVNNLHVYFEQAGNDDENTFSAFTVAANSSETRSFTPNLFVSPVIDSTVRVSGFYGFSALNVWIPFQFTVVGKCA